MRRYFQFSLGTCLIALGWLGGMIAVYSWGDRGVRQLEVALTQSNAELKALQVSERSLSAANNQMDRIEQEFNARLGVIKAECRAIHQRAAELKAQQPSWLALAAHGARFHFDNRGYAVSVAVHRPIHDSLMQQIFRLRELRTIDLSHSGIRDEALVHMQPLPRLEKLVLNDTEVGDRGLACFCDTSTLKEVQVAGTRVTPRGIMALAAALPSLEIASPPEYQPIVDGARLPASR